MSEMIRKALMTVMVTAFTSGVAMSAMAAETKWEMNHPRRDQVNDRLENQNKRIKQEVQEGDISKQQAAQLHQNDKNIRQEERDMASQNGGPNHGHITAAERRVLNQQENANSHKIGN